MLGNIGRDNGACCAGVPVKRSMLEGSVNTMGENITLLEDELERLNVRLAVVSSAKPSNACDTSKPPSQTKAPIIEVIDKTTEKIMAIRAKVIAITERLDI